MSLCGFAVALMLDTPVEPRCVGWETSCTKQNEEVDSVDLADRLVLVSPSPLGCVPPPYFLDIDDTCG